VPIVVAGETEDKMETSRRVQWSGAGINLRTGAPTEEQLATAVGRVLSERRFRDRAHALRNEIVAAPGLPGLERLVTEMVRGRR
jgi:UDP:flavonoid glycosyltransferase YjiC (YdhE family)